MKLIDVLDQLRKEEKISVIHFVDGVMSTHSYYRYVTYQSELKLSQALLLMKKLNRTPESIFDYLATIHQSPKSMFSQFLQAKVNQHHHIINNLREELISYVCDEDQIKDLLKQHPYVESTYHRIYESLLVFDHHQFSSNIANMLNFDFMQKTKDNRYIAGILSYLYVNDLYASSLHKMLKRITNPNFFKSGSWDIPILMSMHVLKMHKYDDYKKYIIMYEKHIKWITKRLYGSLDIGFIEFSYQHLTYLAFLKKDPSFDLMLYRYIATLMLNRDDEQLHESIKTLENMYQMNINDFYESYTKKQIERVIID